LDDAFFERADEFVGERLVRRVRPPKAVNQFLAEHPIKRA
jgi:hypothetical protein